LPTFVTDYAIADALNCPVSAPEVQEPYYRLTALAMIEARERMRAKS
jgi:hypothetical protein